MMRELGDVNGNRWEIQERNESGAREGRDWGEVRVMGCQSQMSTSKLAHLLILCNSLQFFIIFSNP